LIAYVLPTHNRPEVLTRTLDALSNLPAHEAEVIIVDNASRPPPHAPVVLDNGLPVTLVMRGTNEGAAARNAGVRAADPACEWVVMLDDDSAPLDLGFLDVLREQPNDVAAVAAEILLGSSVGSPALRAGATSDTVLPLRHEAGGLPEVFIGCGVALRRQSFLDAGGYDPAFHFYAEEYDLAAKFIRAGQHIIMDRRFRVLHEKTSANRNMDTILRRLVRNNAWVMQRYAPAAMRSAEVRRTLGRYGAIAHKERAEIGYALGVADLARTYFRQAHQELSAAQWDRFTGKAACRRSLLRSWTANRFDTALIVAPGKNEHIVRECLMEMGVRIVSNEADAQAVIIGTLSPGPMLDALEALRAETRVIAPWEEIVEEPASSATERLQRSHAA